MDNFYLNEIVAEVAPIITGRRLGGIALDGSELRLDFGGHRFALVANLSAHDPALYIMSQKRSKPDPNRSWVWDQPHRSSSGQPHSAQQLLLQMRSKLSGARVASLVKEASDRVVMIRLRPPESTPGPDLTLTLILTGRSANALLVGPSGLIDAALKEIGPVKIGNPPPRPRPVPFDPAALFGVGDQALSADQIIESYFNRSSPFSKVYRREFLSRSSSKSPSSAFRNLVEDLFNNKRKPIIYSSAPLEKILTGAVTLERHPRSSTATQAVSSRPIDSIVTEESAVPEFILSCIELSFARDLLRYDFSSFSEAAEVYSETLAAAKALGERHTRLTGALETRLRKLRSALHSIESDLVRLGEPEKLKRFGDLLLASLGTARVEGRIARVKNYYDATESEIEIEIEEDRSLQQAAAAYYERYQKANRALKTLGPRAKEIANQITRTEDLLAALREQPDLQRIQEVEARSGLRRQPESELRVRPGSSTGRTPTMPGKAHRKRAPQIGRRFLSSDGYEIVIGRNDAENDAITFRVAGSLDIWLHAADYPGSHVVIRNPSRQAVPHRTIVEASQVAAFYSQARRQGKAAVKYTQKKFVSKPPKAKPGLVRLSSYKTVMVKPAIPSALDQQSEKI